MKKIYVFQIILLVAVFSACYGQQTIPDVYSNIHRDPDGRLYVEYGDSKAYQADILEPYSLLEIIGSPSGTATGLAFDFGDPGFSGILYYGFIHYEDGKHPVPVYFREFEIIRNGQAHVDILNQFSGRFDMIGWEQSGKGTLGYRVTGLYGNMLYDGKVTFEGKGPFEVSPTVIEGPFVNLLSHDGVTISFKTNMKCKAGVVVNGKKFGSRGTATEHTIELTGLAPDTDYPYTLEGLAEVQKYSFRTAPEPGSRTAFTFAYASDSRSGQGGGERDLYGVNAYIMKKILALSVQQEARFFQFTGDLISGYLSDVDATHLQYANWKRSVEPFWHHIPIYVGMGNHEALEYRFLDSAKNVVMKIDRFPFETESAEAMFMDHFVMPRNGPESEDGAVYDPDPQKTDFPSYKESVFYYTYDNVAMIVLNSDYLYSSTTPFLRVTSGNLHAYILDQQLDWLKSTLAMLEEDENIDHIFVTQHTPAFPNGGHVNDDMWYGGKNDYRPYISGRPLPKGIIERRNEFLDLLINRSSKVVAMLTGDEHNYNRLKITSEMVIHPEMFFGERLEVGREIFQINNGAAGAPYYAQETTPWSDHVQGFTTQNALVLVHVDGIKVRMKVLNPDTLELIDEAVLRD